MVHLIDMVVYLIGSLFEYGCPDFWFTHRLYWSSFYFGSLVVLIWLSSAIQMARRTLDTYHARNVRSA